MAQTNSVKDQNINLSKKRKAEDTQSDNDSHVNDSVLYDDDINSFINGPRTQKVEKKKKMPMRKIMFG